MGQTPADSEREKLAGRSSSREGIVKREDSEVIAVDDEPDVIEIKEEPAEEEGSKRKVQKVLPKSIRAVQQAQHTAWSDAAKGVATKKSKDESGTKMSKNLICQAPQEKSLDECSGVVKINRSPVMILWSAVLAKETLGFNWDEALSLGSTVAALNARSKQMGIRGANRGRGRGRASPNNGSKTGNSSKDSRGDDDAVDGVWLLGREMPARRTTEGVRGWLSDKAMDPKAADRSLRSGFSGEALEQAYSVLLFLARSTKQAIHKDSRLGYSLYERFRPSVAAGAAGWGAAGELKLDLIRSIGEEYGGKSDGKTQRAGAQASIRQFVKKEDGVKKEDAVGSKRAAEDDADGARPPRAARRRSEEAGSAASDSSKAKSAAASSSKQPAAARFFTCYWAPHEAKLFEDVGAAGPRGLHLTGGNAKRQSHDKLKPGDVYFPVKLQKGSLMVLGRLRVEGVVEPRTLTEKEYEEWHSSRRLAMIHRCYSPRILLETEPEKWAGTVGREFRALSDLRWVRPNGEERALTDPTNMRYVSTALQGVYRLSAKSAERLTATLK